MHDVVVVGAGVIGCASALALADRGLSVALVDRGAAGAEASGAAAGIVGAQTEAMADGPFARLLLASRDRYDAWIESLVGRSGIDVGYRVCGVTHVARDAADLEHLDASVGWQRAAGLAVERVDAAALTSLEPALAPAVGGLRFPNEARIDPPLLLAALRAAVVGAGVALLEDAPVRRIRVTEGRAHGVDLEDGRFVDAGAVVLAAGSWSALLEGSTLPAAAVVPARGQIVEVGAPPGTLRGAVFGPDCYLSPRDDGRILVGTTVEFVGFSRGTTASAIAGLLQHAAQLVPAIGEAHVRRAWSGFRPHAPDELPLIGAVGIEGLVVATGHFRNGVLLAPITAEIVASLVTKGAPPVDLSPFLPTRSALRR